MCDHCFYEVKLILKIYFAYGQNTLHTCWEMRLRHANQLPGLHDSSHVGLWWSSYHLTPRSLSSLKGMNILDSFLPTDKFLDMSKEQLDCLDAELTCGTLMDAAHLSSAVIRHIT